jgi:hypothetical protein
VVPFASRSECDGRDVVDELASDDGAGVRPRSERSIKDAEATMLKARRGHLLSVRAGGSGLTAISYAPPRRRADRSSRPEGPYPPLAG